MHNHTKLLVVAGSVCLVLTLVLAWCVAGTRSSGFFKKVFPNYQYLLKAHLDYLMMSGLLLIFYLMFAQLHVVASPVVLVSMGIGSLMNPLGYLMLSMKPTIRQSPGSPFGVLMVGSFTLTTVGYLGAAWYVARAAMS